MRKSLILISLILMGNFSISQIDGNLLLGLTQANTTEMNAIANPTLGSLVYNTTDFSVYQYSGSSWIRVFDSANNGAAGTKLNFGGRWTNNDTTTNLNVDNAIAPIFGTEDYKDDGNALYEVSGNTLMVKEAGRYDIKVNLSFLNISAARNNPTARIAIDGTQTGARGASGYTRNASGHVRSSIHINEILELDADDVITVVMARGGNTGTVRFNTNGESSFVINKLR